MSEGPPEEDMSRHHAHLCAHRWAAARRAVFERDGYRCVQCSRAGRLECDHVTPLDKGGDPWDLVQPANALSRVPYREDARGRTGAP